MNKGAIIDYLVGPSYEDVAGIPIMQRIMRDRQPLKLRRFAAVHNAALFSLSLYMMVETWRQAWNNFGWSKNFRLWCNPVEPGPRFSNTGYALARILYIHYLSKAWEFVDTYIMILKKNDRQVTFLHVYHHATTFFPAWFTSFLNSGIHVFMYGYYFAASLGYRLGFKHLITTSQMVQFCFFITQSVWHLFITDCSRPRLSSVFLLFQCVIFLTLFANFYRKTYRKKPDAKVA